MKTSDFLTLIGIAITGLLSIAALIVSVAAARYTRAQAQEARRANDLLEAEHQRARALEAAEAEANRIRWVIEPAGPNRYALRNVGSEAAEGVEARAPGNLITSGPMVTIDNGEVVLAQETVSKGGPSRSFSPTPARGRVMGMNSW